MIIIMLGGIGSGKTLSAIKQITDSKNFPLTNFNLKNIDYHRLLFNDIILTDDKNRCVDVNWEFWENIRKTKKNYSIFLDEIHNVASSRQSMTKRNILMSKWISQIRKILSDHETNHLYLISQTYRKIDVDFRELANIFIVCSKIMINNRMYVKQRFYDGFENFIIKKSAGKKVFIADNYFKYYDRNEMVRFTDGEDYV